MSTAPTTMICLIGEQPIPNLLPILHYRPNCVLLVHSQRTLRVAENLAAVVKSQQPQTRVAQCSVADAYDVADILDRVEQELNAQSATKLLINLTGGTKPMMLASFELALSRKAASFYFKSEGLLNEIFYFPETTLPVPKIASSPFGTTLTVDLHAAAFGREYAPPKANHKPEPFEAAVAAALQAEVPSSFDEVVVGARYTDSVEIDVIVRWKNQLAFCEVYHSDPDRTAQKHDAKDKGSTPAKLKRKLDQLSTAGGQNYFGTYIRKILIFSGTDAKISDEQRRLNEAQRVFCIPIECEPDGSLSPSVRSHLVSQIVDIVTPRF